jgi:hypothetical protein
MEQGGMRKAGKEWGKLFARVAILGISTQILLGIFWMLRNFTAFQEFGESRFLQRVQETLICDEYTGILYPLLMRMLSGMGSALSVPAHCLIYGLQIIVAAGAAYYFLLGFPSVRRQPWFARLWAMLALLTFPTAAQCHLAVLPISLASSLFLTSVGILLRAWQGVEQGVKMKEGTTRRFCWNRPAARLVWFGLLWFLETLLLPEYYLFGAVFVLLYAGRMYSKSFYVIVIAAVLISVIPLVSSLTVREGAYGRMHNTLEAAALRRLAWEHLADDYPDWPAELQEALSQEDILRMSAHPAQMPWVLGEKVDASLGKDGARKIYGRLAMTMGKHRWQENAKEILGDTIAYTLAPAAQLFLLSGRGRDGYTGMNYEMMRAKTPKLTSVFVKFGGGCLVGSLLCGAVLAIFVFCGKDRREKKICLREGICFLTPFAVMILFHVLRAGGSMDEKNVLPVTAAWITCCLLTIIKILEEKEQEGESGK